MDTNGLGLATKNIFVQCLNDPEIMEILKGKLNASEENQNTNIVQVLEQNGCNIGDRSVSNVITIEEKIDEILRMQSNIEAYISDTTTKEIEDLNEKLEQEKNSHVLDIEALKKEYETEINQYKEQLGNAKAENETLGGKIETLLSINATMEENRTKLENKYSICEELLDIWNCLKSLKQDNREYIERLCGGAELLSILSLGRDENKIEQLWLYLRDLAIKGDEEREDVSILSQYFEFCIKVYNSTKQGDEKYKILDVEIGDEFDINLSIRTADSKQIGSVKSVIVKGFFRGNVNIFKSIVRVE